ncbi:MAG TPA: hypothetical protein VK607_09540 [Kofleriaceae bacterium]|nr:hypothetical protein [Kofleriaceae bacterium]HMG56688.1 hypothetical protein [Kofleriaceae bacterium]
MTGRTIAMTCAALAAGATGAGCGDNRPTEGEAAGEPCAAAFSENFAETSSDPANCPAVETADGHTTLRFALPSQTIGAEFAIAIDLGEAPSPGLYTAQSLATPWSADALHEFEMTSCLYHAGTAAVPPGTFQLALDALDTGDAGVHGQLDVVLYVLARPYTYCGETNIEHVAVTF